jgi:hypothetical protein
MKELGPTDYYMLDADHPEDIMLLRSLQPVGGTSWESGHSFTTAVPHPLHVDIVDGYEEDTEPPVYTSRVPMMRDDLLDCFRAIGVDNIDAYPIVILNRLTGREIRGYSAINIIGLVRAAATDLTVYSPGNPSRVIDADIDSLGIDSNRAKGLLLFRLAEAVTGVVVHAKIKRSVEARGAFPHLRFVHPKDWMG